MSNVLGTCGMYERKEREEGTSVKQKGDVWVCVITGCQIRQFSIDNQRVCPVTESAGVWDMNDKKEWYAHYKKETGMFIVHHRSS